MTMDLETKTFGFGKRIVVWTLGMACNEEDDKRGMLYLPDIESRPLFSLDERERERERERDFRIFVNFK